MKKRRALGRKVTSFEGFDTFRKPKHIDEVTCISDEVTAVCPVTGQPDWYTVKIMYYPALLCVESKSLKLYLQSFRNKGLFCESFASTIAQDLFDALHPKIIVVSITQKSRGGISIIAHATITKKENS